MPYIIIILPILHVTAGRSDRVANMRGRDGKREERTGGDKDSTRLANRHTVNIINDRLRYFNEFNV